MRLNLVFVLILVPCSVFAQTVTQIDARGAERPVGARQYVPCSGTTGNGIIQSITAGPRIRVVVEVPEAVDQGKKMLYELTITNLTAEDFVMPRSLKAAEVVMPQALEQEYKTAMVSFLLQGPDSAQGVMPAGLMLYGSASEPATVAVLKPGDSVRLSGTAAVAPQWATKVAGSVDTSLSAVLQMATVTDELTAEPGCDGHDIETAEGPSFRSENAVAVKIRVPKS
ncbi:MAG: hypothetical protein WBS19_07470 [Candidatus Korobacteraceae bacterium]